MLSTPGPTDEPLLCAVLEAVTGTATNKKSSCPGTGCTHGVNPPLNLYASNSSYAVRSAASLASVCIRRSWVGMAGRMPPALASSARRLEALVQSQPFRTEQHGNDWAICAPHWASMVDRGPGAVRHRTDASAAPEPVVPSPSKERNAACATSESATVSANLSASAAALDAAVAYSSHAGRSTPCSSNASAELSTAIALAAVTGLCLPPSRRSFSSICGRNSLRSLSTRRF